MIGVIAKPTQYAAVAELFELFKTPWESFKSDRTYDVVVATADEVAGVIARLLLVYGAETKNIDAPNGITTRAVGQNPTLECGRWSVPIYSHLSTFAVGTRGTPCAMSAGEPCGMRLDNHQGTVIRLGYDLFEEVSILLTNGQPVEHAHVPTLDAHIAMLRDWILDAGISLVEIPPVPEGYRFAVCLTHDIDFVGIRRHKFDHSMWGFLYRSTIGSTVDLVRRRVSVSRFLGNWRAALTLPFVHIGWAKDFWEPFDWYLKVEENLPATYYVIPFKRRAGDRVTAAGASRRASAYDVDDVQESIAALRGAGCEVGVHGIDAWHSVEKGREERARITRATGETDAGIRMHWLLQDADTPIVLERAGYSYDSTVGYNETVGYRSGTTQVFRPLAARTLLELPLHIQDGALFYSKRLGLSEPEAEERCGEMITLAQEIGGALTVLWHDRSHGPERFWGDFYVKLVHALTTANAWFGTAAQIVTWFRQRRDVRFERLGDSGAISVRYEGEAVQPPLCMRLHQVSTAGRHAPVVVDVPWNGKTVIHLNSSACVSASAARLPAISC